MTFPTETGKIDQWSWFCDTNISEVDLYSDMSENIEFKSDMYTEPLAWLASKELKIDKDSRIAIDTEDRNIKYFLQKYFPKKINTIDISRDALLIRAVKSQYEWKNYFIACHALDAAFDNICYEESHLNTLKLSEVDLQNIARKKVLEQLEYFSEFYKDNRIYPDQSSYTGSKVSSGPYTANIHHKSSPNKIVNFGEEIVFFNLHLSYDGYDFEFERTVMPQKIKRGIQKNIDILDEMNKVALKNLMPGVEPYTVYEKVRQVMYSHGLKDNWKCGGGHGMGLDYYEYPNLSKKAFSRSRGYELEKYMITSVEPRLDFKDYGLMNSTLFILTENGPERLSSIPHSLNECMESYDYERMERVYQNNHI